MTLLTLLAVGILPLFAPPLGALSPPMALVSSCFGAARDVDFGCGLAVIVAPVWCVAARDLWNRALARLEREAGREQALQVQPLETR